MQYSGLEIDGGIHDNPEVSERDSNRTFELDQPGITVKRIANSEIKENIGSVLIKIEGWLEDTIEKR